MNSIAAFALLSLILTITPGPDSLLVLRSSLRGGRHTRTRVAGGAASGSRTGNGRENVPDRQSWFHR